MIVSENAWYDEVNPIMPRAFCFADIGCSAGTAAKQQLFLSETLEAVAPAATDGGYTPVFSVRQIDNGTWVGTLSKYGSSNPAEAVTITQMKRPVDPDQPLRFTVISGNWSREPGTNIWMDTKADLASADDSLHYTITSTTSRTIPEMTITPQIWRQEKAGAPLHPPPPACPASPKPQRITAPWDMRSIA